MTAPANQMSPLGLAISKSRTCHCQISADELLAGIAEIRQLDKHSEKKQYRGCMQAVISMVVAIGGFFGAAIAEDPWPLVVSLVAVIFAIVSVSMRLFHGKTNFEDRRYELVARLVGMLRKDMSPDALFDVALNLLPQDDKSKFTQKGKAGHWDVKYFHDPWLTLEGRLLDGTKFSLHMAEKHQARSRMKRGRSGKMKHKSKSKNSSEATLFLKVKADKYPQLTLLGESAQGAVQLPAWADKKALDVEADTLTLRVTTRSGWKVSLPPTEPEVDPSTTNAKKPVRKPASVSADGVELVTSMFLSLYQVLNLAREISKKQS